MVINVLEFSRTAQLLFQKLVIIHFSVEGGRIYVIKFSRTVSIVHVMLNQGPEGQRLDYLQAVKAARPELQVNVKEVFCQ